MSSFLKFSSWFPCAARGMTLLVCNLDCEYKCWNFFKKAMRRGHTNQSHVQLLNSHWKASWGYSHCEIGRFGGEPGLRVLPCPASSNYDSGVFWQPSVNLENRLYLCNFSFSLSFCASALIDCLINPLQEQMEEWKKVANQLDKDHAKGTGLTHVSLRWQVTGCC